MAESVQASLGILRRLGRRRKHHARGSDGCRHAARLQNAHAHRARALVARARGHRRSCLQSRQARRPLADARANLRRLVYPGQPAHVDACRLGHFARPAAVRHVEQQRAARLLHVDGKLTGQPVAHIILGAHHVADLREDLRLVRLDPQQLGQREVGQRGIAGKLDQLLVADLLGQPVALRLRARVAPDERRAQHRALFVEHHRAVHLSGERDRRNRLHAVPGVAASAPRMASCAARHQSSGSCSAHPGCSARKGACSHEAAPISLPAAIHHDGPRAARSHIHAQEPHSHVPPCLNRFSDAPEAYQLRRVRGKLCKHRKRAFSTFGA